MTFIICAFSLAFSIASIAISLLRLNLLIQKRQRPDNVGQKDKAEVGNAKKETGK